MLNPAVAPLSHSAPCPRRVRATRILALGLGLGLGLGLACSGGGGTLQLAQAQALVSASNSAGNSGWDVIGMKFQSLALVQEDGTSVPVLSATDPQDLAINLAQLGQGLATVGQFPVPSGSYTGVVASLSANPGDIELIASATPQAGTGLAAGAEVPGDQIVSEGVSGSPGNQVVTVQVPFAQPLVLAPGQTTDVDLDFSLNLSQRSAPKASQTTPNLDLAVAISPGPRMLESSALRTEVTYGRIDSVSTVPYAKFIVRELQAFGSDPVQAEVLNRNRTWPDIVITGYRDLDRGGETVRYAGLSANIGRYSRVTKITERVFDRIMGEYYWETLSVNVLISSSFDSLYKAPNTVP